jgi:DNA topoisomerase-2
MSAITTANEYQTLSTEDHIDKKDMWAGAQTKMSIKNLYGIIGNKLTLITNDHTPALLKIFDECIVNASDHAMEHMAMKKAADRVSYIKTTFDISTGITIIENDGPGIPVIENPEMTTKYGRPMFIPEIAFSIPFTGRNMDKREYSIKGGVNGIGAKIGNILSTKFQLLTVGRNESEKLTLFVQNFSDGMKTRDTPLIATTTTNKAKEYFNSNPHITKQSNTRLTFTPNYKKFGYGNQSVFNTNESNELDGWVRWRMYLLAAYVGNKVKVSYNGTECNTVSAESLLKFMLTSDDGDTQVQPSFTPDIFTIKSKAIAEHYNQYNWDIAIAIDPTNTKFKCTTIVNGVQCTTGNHISYFKKLISDAINEHIKKVKSAAKDTKNLTPAETCKYLNMVIIGALPGAKWDAQNKESLQVTDTVMKKYTIPPAKLKQIAIVAAETILNSITKRTPRKKKVECDKYIGANKAGTKDSHKCSLIAAEGDSAISLIKSGLVYGESKPNTKPGSVYATFDYFGIISLGGVIINAIKKSTIIGTKIIQSEQLQDNKVLKSMVEVLGLDFNCRYDTKSDLLTLRYGALIIATDQDLDGTGKILPLVLVWIHTFWPNLYKHGFVKCYRTPIIRVYKSLSNGRINPKIPPKEFYYENEFREWDALQTPEDKKTNDVKYYKGLASHDPKQEMPMMFGHFFDDIYTFKLNIDEKGIDLDNRWFEIYYGKDTNIRKIELSTPVQFLSIEDLTQIKQSRIIPCETQLTVDAKAYKHDDIQRKIPNALTGIPVARTKILYAALKVLSNNNKDRKVYQLGGKVAELAHYHHGDASLNGTIINMTQRFPNANRYPIFTGIGQFGTRYSNGSDAGAARYIYVRLAKPFACAVFPQEDSYLLPYVEEDGERAQPQYYVPVIPTSMIESSKLPSEGWKHESHARDIYDVINLINGYLSGDSLVIKIATIMETKPPGFQIQSLRQNITAARGHIQPDNTAARGPIQPNNTITDAEYTEFMTKYPLKTCIREYGSTLTSEQRSNLLRQYNGREYSFGEYYIDKNNDVIITELPITVSTESFIKSLKSKERIEYIEDVDGKRSSDYKIDIRITFKPGATDFIEANFGDSDIDAYEDFLNLRKSTKSLLNYFKPGGGVIEFNEDYHSLFFYWLPFRRNLYQVRYQRNLVQLKLKIMMEENIIRYIENPDKDLIKELDEESASISLMKLGFIRFNHAIINCPKYTNTADIEQIATGPTATYDYLLDLRERELVISAKNKRVENLKKLKAEYDTLIGLGNELPFTYASVWKSEVDKVITAIELGIKTNWEF